MSSQSKSSSTPWLMPTENAIVDGVLRYPPTGIKALAVGAGAGGLMVALENWRKGIDVEVVEKSDELLTIGGNFSINPSGLTTIHHYPSMLKEYDEISRDIPLVIAAKDGTKIMPPVEFEWNREGVAQHAAYPLRVKPFMSRAEFTKMLFDQCTRLGIPITFGVTIERYEEDMAKGIATAVAQDGRRYTADIVIAADGIGTKSHTLTLGRPVEALQTGFTIYRAMYPTDRLKSVSFAEDYIRNLQRSSATLLQSDKAYCIFSFNRNLVYLALTTKEDDTTVTESWTSTVTNERALAALRDPDTWSPWVREIISHAPENSIIRSSICFRDPQPCWTSPSGRIVQLGDSAHSFLPSSGNGATQALEDASSMAECLRLGGKERVGVSTKVHELLRYKRVSLLQLVGFVNMQEFHRDHNPKATAKDPPILMGKWLWAHNPEKYATENFTKARAHLEKGSPFENTNLPPGHKWRDWSMENELSKQKVGIDTKQELKANGDWGLI